MKTFAMKKIRNRALATVAGFGWGLLSLAPAYASDTEVYSRRVEVSGDSAPVLMMVLDTSDSMLRCVASDATTCTGTGTRVGTLIDTFQKVLFGDPVAANPIKPAPGYLRLGYSRFNPNNNQMGWVHYAADKKLDQIVTSAGLPFSGAATAQVSASAFDATDGGAGDLTFTIGRASSVNFPLLLPNPDVGVQFPAINVPKNAVILSATLSFSEETAPTGTVNIQVAAEDPTSTGVAGVSYATTNVTSRSYKSFRAAPYTGGVINVREAVADAVQDSDWCEGNALALRIKSMGTDFKTGPTWNSAPVATIRSWDGATATANAVPQLNITYRLDNLADTCALSTIHVVKSIRDGDADAALDDVEWAWGGSRVIHDNADLQPAGITTLTDAGGTASTALNVVGVRFAEVAVPRTATIDKAWLYATGYTSSVTGPAATVAVDAINADNVAPLCTRNTTTRRVSCAKPDESSTTPVTALSRFAFPKSGTTTSDSDVYVANVTDAVQTIVNRGGWATDNAMAFRLYNNNAGSTTTNMLALSAMEASPSRGMVLHIIYKVRTTSLGSVAKTVRQDLGEDMRYYLGNSLGSHSSLGATVFETAKYMLGKPVNRTDIIPDFAGIADNDIDLPRTAVLNPAITSEATYKSPVGSGSECSANYLYVLTDGVPDDASRLTPLAGEVFAGAPNVASTAACESNTVPLSGGNNQTNFGCMMGVAKAMATANTSLGKEIRTNTVLFGPVVSPTATTTDIYKTREDLRTVAANGSGRFYDANSGEALMRSLLDTLSALIDVSGTITAPGVAVNQFNRLTHLDQLYYAVFDPQTEQSRWLGNVKRYRLAFIDTPVTLTNTDGTTTTTIRQTAEIRDMNNANAVNVNTGFFKQDAQSYWSAQADGDKAFEGGAAKRIPDPGVRKLFTNVTNDALLERVTLGASPVPTTANARALPGLTALTDIQFENLRRWMLGFNIDIVTEAVGTTPARINTVLQATTNVGTRKQIGGVLHSQPVLVNYGYTGDLASVQNNPDQQKNVLFFSDMEGILHAINAKQNATDGGGQELFAFLPRETLQRMDEIALNGLGTVGLDGQRVPEFGLDSTWTVWRDDADKDQQISSSGAAGDKVWIFAGMRMGGKTVYALNVTNPESPVLKWTRSPANGGAWANMGQTWSKPVLGDIKIGTTIKKVLFMGGGYDVDHERTTAYAAATDAQDDQGHQVYMVDPDDGRVIAWASKESGATKQVADMKFSIPSELKLFDSNKDGLVDSVYFGDLGGQVFRMDIANGSAEADIIKRVKLLARVSSHVEGENTHRRRFYEAPAVATMLDANNSTYAAVALGSGFRSHPLNTATYDYFYVFKDRDVTSGALLTTADADLQPTLTTADLATVVAVGSDTDGDAATTGDYVSATDRTGVTNTNGWMMKLPDTGEKVMANALILFGEVFFTSYVPDLTAGSSCAPVIGRSKLWRMGVAKAEVLADYNNDGVVNDEDRYTDNVVQGLGGAPQLIVGEDGKNAVLAGTGVTRNRDLAPPGTRRTRWYEKK